MFEMLAIAAAVVAGPNHQPGYYGGGRALATEVAYEGNRVDDIARPGFNGRLWRSEAIIGPRRFSWAGPTESRARQQFGASSEEVAGGRVYVDIGDQVVGISPWRRIGDKTLQHFEDARRDWLQENGYTGGVRTFTNQRYVRRDARPLAAAGGKSEDAGKAPTPRATIQLAPEATKFRKRMQVRGVEGGKVSLPSSAPAALRERVSGVRTVAAR